MKQRILFTMAPFEKKMPQWKEGSEFKSVLEGTISGSHIFTHHRTPIGNYGGVIE